MAKHICFTNYGGLLKFEVDSHANSFCFLEISTVLEAASKTKCFELAVYLSGAVGWNWTLISSRRTMFGEG